ncbi:hypothetical protein PRIPAC_96732 [Pristionchus pacificus]|uniref:Uncharacterized protein n=1 Tax=Pristionchus pacificus TaxID=54126 RepID=A0A2A6D2K1_PRIPA|nr:hypothetical protein PRIPAC_96732 [Pristionchus pacificus]|eukprot:PDM84645.1 hypothetical protein PRIPAC_33668 [Pristionchus pacificus]
MRRLLVLSVFFSTTVAALDLRSLSSMYTAPTCEHRQSCLFMMDDFRFELCGCPNDTQCSGKYSAVHQGTKYSFCTDPQLDQCASGDLSVTVEGLQTTLHCACAKPLVERKIIDTESAATKFVCESPPNTLPISAKMNKLMNFWKYRTAKYQERGAMYRLRRKQMQSVRCQSKDDLC